MLGDDPPYLSVGTEVSAKYKGAFCEAKIRKVVRSVKCRVTYKQGLGTATVADDQIKGTLRVGASVEARHTDRKDFVEATITKIQDCSQYTVVFDDGDITTLRRTALCLKSGRHFAESETLDQLPLTHPEHFGNPVIGGRRGRRSRQTQDDSSDDDDDAPRGSNDSASGSGGKEGSETEPEIGRVVCVELGDKKKKDNWFPGLVVAPTAQDTVRIRVRDDYLVRSFKDARYYTVPKKEATEFTKELVNKIENISLKIAVEKALLFLEENELPPHWDRDSLFGNSVSSGNSDSDGELDSDSSDDEPREEKDHFVAQLYKFMDDRGTPINNCPMIGNEDIDLYRLFRAVYKLGGYNRVTNQNQWKLITRRLSFSMQNNSSTHNLVKQAYKKFLHSFEDFYRKLGCTMVNHPRGSMRKQRPGRSLIRDKDRNTPVPTQDKMVIKTEKEEDEKEVKKSSGVTPDEEIKKEKREIKKEAVVKEEEVSAKVKRKEEPVEESVSGQESDVNIEGEEESSSSEKSQKSSTSRLTPSSNVSSKSKATSAAAATTTAARNKEEVSKKKAAPEKRKVEPKKQEKKDDKAKDEDSTKTRSKSKEDVIKSSKPNSSDARETRTPSRESDKKAFNKQRRMTDEELKKRGRKKKEVEGEKGKVSEERSVEYAPSYKGPVEIGDRLKVYYGPTHESKVTYEAKVIDMEKDVTEAVYLVHYTGWNTRYDEWIKSSRIAQNFTQAQGRVKRTKTTPRPQTPSANSSNKSSKGATAPNAGTGAASTASAQSRRRAQGDVPSSGNPSALGNKDSRKDDREGTPATRSTTPSPLTSCTSRTKSPATTANNRTTRVTRNADFSSLTNELGRRTRRTSGHANAMVAEESESEDSDSIESETSAEHEITQVQSRSRVIAFARERNRREARRRAESRMRIEETSDAEIEKDVEEPRRGRRSRKTVGKLQEVKSEPESEEEQPKGRDFDLNQIRSELKGFDKAVKLEMTSVEPDQDEQEEQTSNPVKQEKMESESHSDKKVILELEKKREIPKVELQSSPPIKREPIKVEANQSENTEDIYEFKEPEPFEFEVRNKRDSGGSSSSNTTDKEKDKDKDSKDKQKKRTFEEDTKSPKKRQKTFGGGTSGGVGTPSSAVKVEQKSESSVPEQQSTDTKKKVRKIFKKNEEQEEVEAENEDSNSTAPRDISKFLPANYSGVMVFKRKDAFVNTMRNNEEPAVGAAVMAAENSTDSPKKRQPKTFGSAASIRNNENKDVSMQDSSDNKKKLRKLFNKQADETEETGEAPSGKELTKFFPNYSSAKTPARKDEGDENSLSESGKEKPKKTADEDTLKTQKKRQKNVGTAAVSKTSEINNTTDIATDTKKKQQPIRGRIPVSKKETAGTDDSGSDDVETSGTTGAMVTRDHATKYFSQYSGPKAKAAASASENESAQDRLAVSKSETQVREEPSKLPPISANTSVSHDKDSGKLKSGESVASSSVDNKQASTSSDKKRLSDSAASNKTEPKQELKTLDFTPIVPHTLPVPAPISARLPATASIEEKLSAAAVFRSKLKDTKKDEDLDNIPRKTLKEVTKKTETISAKKAKEKEESKVKHEPEKKKQPLEPSIPKKDPLQEIEVRKDPLLEVIMKKKEDEIIKSKKESETKAQVPTPNTIPKTYGGQRKDPGSKIEETWKKSTTAIAATPGNSNENVTGNLLNTDLVKDYVAVRKETIVSKIKSSIDRDSVDSTDSSDSERRLTIIDSEDLPDEKCIDPSSEVKSKTVPTPVVSGQFNSITQQQRASPIVPPHNEVHQHIIGITSVVGTMIQTKNIKMEEDGENLNSLLCEEEIPGSPTPGSESMDQEHRASSSQNLAKTDLGSKMAVAFVAAQLPLSTIPSSTQLTNSAMVTTMSGGVLVPQSTNNLVTVSMTVQHASIQPLRQAQPHLQLLPQPLHQAQHAPQPAQVHQQHLHHQQQQHQPQQQHHDQQNPAPMVVAPQRRESNEAAPVMDNTPPTTPDSSISNISGSPRDERIGGSTPSSSEDNSKLNRDSSEAENDSGGKGSGPSEDDGSSIVNSEHGGNGGATSSSSDRIPKPPAKRGVNDNETVSPKKRKKRKDQDSNLSTNQQNHSITSGKRSPRQSTRNTRHGTGSDSDDTSEGSNQCINNASQPNSNLAKSDVPPNIARSMTSERSSADASMNTKPNTNTKYNFLVDLDPSLDGPQRIAILQQQMTELRKTYMSVKVELSALERRRKKLKRREREAQKAAKAEMQQACS